MAAAAQRSVGWTLLQPSAVRPVQHWLVGGERRWSGSSSPNGVELNRERGDRWAPEGHAASTSEVAATEGGGAARQGATGDPSSLRTQLNMRDLPGLFGDARSRKRRIIGHFGPTNSGKTYSAMKALQAAETAAYGGPLRLLAYEMFERVTAAEASPQRECNLATGQELIQVDDATHCVSTVEMITLAERYDVLVLDEIQMIADPRRGWAWTRALLGVQASEVHVCGDPAAESLVGQLAAACGDDFEVIRYERLTPLTVDDIPPLPSVEHVRPGDCVIAFSRNKLYKFKQMIESSGQKCCIVYGGLPAHARREQARLFNEPGSGADVMVATDAVGMGLNLNIGRIIFSEISKFDGSKRRNLSTMEFRQIAGRAGRFNTKYPNGEALVVGSDEQAKTLVEAFKQPVEPIPKAGLFPPDEVLIKYATEAEVQLGRPIPFSEVIQDCVQSIQYNSDLFFLCEENGKEWIELAQLIDDIELAIGDRVILCKTPIRLRDGLQKKTVIDLAHQLSAVYSGNATEVTLPSFLSDEFDFKVSDGAMCPPSVPKSFSQISKTEDLCSILGIYIWLGLRFESFCDIEQAQNALLLYTDVIDKGLASLPLAENFSLSSTKLAMKRRQKKLRLQIAKHPHVEAPAAAHLEEAILKLGDTSEQKKKTRRERRVQKLRASDSSKQSKREKVSPKQSRRKDKSREDSAIHSFSTNKDGTRTSRLQKDDLSSSSSRSKQRTELESHYFLRPKQLDRKKERLNPVRHKEQRQSLPPDAHRGSNKLSAKWKPWIDNEADETKSANPLARAWDKIRGIFK